MYGSLLSSALPSRPRLRSDGGSWDSRWKASSGGGVGNNGGLIVACVVNVLSWSWGHGRLRYLMADSKSVGMGAVRRAEIMDLRTIAQNLRMTEAKVSILHGYAYLFTAILRLRF